MAGTSPATTSLREQSSYERRAERGSKLSLSNIWLQTHTIASRDARGVRAVHDAWPSNEQRAQGKPGAKCTRSLACENKKARKQSHHRFTGNDPAFPARMVLTVSFVLSPVIGLCCHRRWPRCVSIVTNLMPASRHQDHTTSPSAIEAPSSVARSRPSHPALCVRDDRDTPLMRGGTAGEEATDLGSRISEIFFG
jgi:hypothetical protein